MLNVTNAGEESMSIRRLGCVVCIAWFGLACKPDGEAVTPAGASASRSSAADDQGAATERPQLSAGPPEVVPDEESGSSPKAWGTAQRLHVENPGNAMFPRIGMDAAGNAMVAWYVDGERTADVLARPYDAKIRSWGPVTVLEGSQEDARSPKVAVMPGGDAAVVWRQAKRKKYDIHVRRYDAQGEAWGDVAFVDTDERGSSEAPHIAADHAGNITVVWERYDGRKFAVYANRYDARDDRWGTALPLENRPGNALAPQVAVDVDGNAFAFWHQRTDLRSGIFSTWYDARTNRWGTPIRIDGHPEGGAHYPRPAIDGVGNVHVVWNQEGDTNTVHANRHDAATGAWTGLTTFEPQNKRPAASPNVAANRAGDAVASWQQHDGKWMSIYASRYDRHSGSWSEAVLLESGDSGSAFSTDVGLDASGSAIVVWSQQDGRRYDVHANRYDAASESWGTSTLLETDDTGDAQWSHVAVADDGLAIAVWRQHDGDRGQIYVNHYE
jgi:hypothetical protein